MLSLTLVTLLLSVVSPVVRASSCLAMDIDFNLMVFGLGGKDFNAGTQDSWSTGTTGPPAHQYDFLTQFRLLIGAAPVDITATGRPPFDGENTTCYLAQFFNAIYVLNGDSSNPTAVYIYNVASKSWSKQSVSAPSGSPSFDPSNFKAILDHDTNVFYALSHGEMFMLDMSSLTSAGSTALAWADVGTPSFTTANYNPVMALAQNHIHFLDVPGLSAGQADIFVIHFSFFQPDAQSYPANDGSLFPLVHGQTASFFELAGVQEEFAFIPDDFSATYVINVETNTTKVLAAPATQDVGATYFAGVTSLVQLDTKGNVMFLPYNPNNTDTSAQWTKISSIVVPPPSTSSPNLSIPAGETMTRTPVGTGRTGTIVAAQATDTPNAAVADRALGGLVALLTGLAVIWTLF